MAEDLTLDGDGQVANGLERLRAITFTLQRRQKEVDGLSQVTETNNKTIQKYKTEMTEFSKLDLCEGGSFSSTIFNSDIELNVSPFRVLYLFVTLSICRCVECNICRKFAHCFV